jgi:hypothetical protein
MNVSRSAWEKLLLHWCEMQETGEVKLMCAVIADGIIERVRHPWFFSGGGFDKYCRAIGLDPEFVQQQIKRSEDYPGEWSEELRLIRDKDKKATQ